MNIVVCVKQVPGTTQVEIDEETGVLKRGGVSSKMNPYDLYALETALLLRQRRGGRVVVLTMGPPQAEAVIREAYMMGADDGYLLSDGRFAGSDVLATSYTLAGGIRKIAEYDLIICGKQTTDGDTAQVGPAIAEHLNIPHAAWVQTVEALEDGGIVVEQNMEDSLERVRLPFPCLITVEKDSCIPRLPSYLRYKQTAGRPVHRLALEDLPDQSEGRYGLLGSPTQVERVFQPERAQDRVVWDGESTDCAGQLFDLLRREKYL